MIYPCFVCECCSVLQAWRVQHCDGRLESAGCRALLLGSGTQCGHCGPLRCRILGPSVPDTQRYQRQQHTHRGVQSRSTHCRHSRLQPQVWQSAETHRYSLISRSLTWTSFLTPAYNYYFTSVLYFNEHNIYLYYYIKIYLWYFMKKSQNTYAITFNSNFFSFRGCSIFFKV